MTGRLHKGQVVTVHHGSDRGPGCPATEAATVTSVTDLGGRHPAVYVTYTDRTTGRVSPRQITTIERHTVSETPRPLTADEVDAYGLTQHGHPMTGRVWTTDDDEVKEIVAALITSPFSRDEIMADPGGIAAYVLPASTDDGAAALALKVIASDEG